MESSSSKQEFVAAGGDLSPIRTAKAGDLGNIADAATSGWTGGVGGTLGGSGAIYTTQTIGDPLMSQGAEVINEYTALTIPAFLRGVRFLSEMLAGVPKLVMQQTEPTVQLQLHDHPINFLLNREPNELQTAAQFWETLYHHAIVWGNGYGLIIYAPDGVTVLAIYNLPPDRVIPFRFRGKQYFALQNFGGQAAESQWLALPSDYVLHIPGFGFDGMCGYPIVQLMAESLRVGKSAELYSAKFFKQGRAGLILTRADDNKLSPAAVADLRYQIEQNQSGAQNGWKTLVLPPGLTVVDSTVPNDGAQLLQTKQFSILDVARILGVEPFVLYDYGRATWANLESMNTQLVQYSLMPWVQKSEQELSRKLFTLNQRRQQRLQVKFSLDALTRGDLSQQLANASLRLNNGITAVNEERANLDLPPLKDPGANVPRVPTNIEPIDKPAGPPTPPPPPHMTPVQPAADDGGKSK